MVLAHSQARRDSALFEKIKCIFSIAPVGIFGEVAGVFLTKKHSPDAGVGSTGRWSRASGAVSVTLVCRAHRSLAPDAGRLLFARPVVRDVS